MDPVLFSISRYVAAREIRHDGIHLKGRDIPSPQRRDEERDDACPRPEVCDAILCLRLHIVCEQYGVHREAELIRPLDETHAIPHQIVEPLAIFQRPLSHFPPALPHPRKASSSSGHQAAP